MRAMLGAKHVHRHFGPSMKSLVNFCHRRAYEYSMSLYSLDVPELVDATLTLLRTQFRISSGSEKLCTIRVLTINRNASP